MYTNQKALRKAFKNQFPTLDFKKINGDYKTDTRVAFCDWIDYLNKDNQISDKLANRATL